MSAADPPVICDRAPAGQGNSGPRVNPGASLLVPACRFDGRQEVYGNSHRPRKFDHINLRAVQPDVVRKQFPVRLTHRRRVDVAVLPALANHLAVIYVGDEVPVFKCLDADPCQPSETEGADVR